MADFFVAIVSTLATLLLSYLFWQWYTNRNNLTKEKKNTPVLSRADMRQNRIKRFEVREDGSVIDNNSPASSTGPDNSRNLEKTAKDRELQTPESSAESGDDKSSATNFQEKLNSDSLQADSSNNQQSKYSVQKSSSNIKPDNSRKWVRLSMSNADGQSEPVARPLTSLDELQAWMEGFDEQNVSSVPLRRMGNSLEQRPRTIVCHDMKGGYVQDRFVQGYPSAECYRIYHWQHIDIFVYFSHNFITIPPPCWTNTAHKHGVLVLGTFITEWNDGAVRCAEIFKDQLSYRQVADQLVLIAKYYGFDGWLINIENPIQPAQMNNLVEFVKYLTDRMHQASPGSLIIWYDSVTYKGELKWQNKLNAENRVFFDMSDGIFLNYGWNLMDLTYSVRAAGHERQYDVYVGVDVFGRGVYGGGGWNTNKATHVIKENDLSLALFAPGWVYEKFESTFKASQDKFWGSIASDCSLHALGPSLPFVTSFCQGYGAKWFSYGKVALDHPWTHLSAQEIQPSYVNQIYSLGVGNGILITTVDHHIEDSYRGGGCLTLQGSTKHTTSPCKAVVRLFKTDIELPSTTVIGLTFKVDNGSSLDVALQLHVDKKPNYIMLCPAATENTPDAQKLDSLNEALMQRYGVPRSEQVNSTRMESVSVGQEHYRSFSPVIGDHHKRLAELCCDEENMSWCTRYYLLAEKELKGSHIKEIRLVLINKTISGSMAESSLTPFQLYLGEIKITRFSSSAALPKIINFFKIIDAVWLRKPPPIITSLKCLESEIKCQSLDSHTVAITLTLSWTYDSSKSWQRFEIYQLTADESTVFLGLAYCTSYVVSKLALPKPQKEARFIVQAIASSQRKLPLNKCPAITVYWS